ncbi:MAG: hypothetical protein HY520_03045, partial [Candidatus Aenigmarchaeota archaeon]|nr:hypothetical protein [Candidatus Aenigmarchaeota archaeon]
FYCVDQAGPCTPSLSGTVVSISAEGTTYLSYRSIDNAGNIESTKTTTVQIDRTPPTSSADPLPPYTTAAVFAVAFSSFDPLSGVASVELFFRKDSGNWISYGLFPPPGPISFDSGTTGGDGFYEFEVVATDNANNPEQQTQIAEAFTTVDTVAPITTDNAPAGWQNSILIPVNLTPTDPFPGSGVADTLYCVDQLGPCTPSLSGTVVSISAEGTTYLSYHSIDNAGNIESTKTTTVQIDRTPPTSSASPLDNYTTSVIFNISYTQNDPLSGVASVELFYSKDSGTWTLYGTFFSSPISFDSGTTGGDGFYEFEVVATDNANNPEQQTQIAEASTTVDTVPPVTTDDAPAGWQNFVPIIVTLTPDDPFPGSGVAGTFYCFDQIGSCIPSISGTTISISDEGTTYLSYRSIDNAGNIESTKTTTVQIDLSPPVVTPQPTLYPGSQTAAKNSDTITLQALAADPASGISTVTVNASSLGCGILAMAPAGGDLYTAECTLLNASEGTSLLPVTATDGGGFTNSGETLEVMVDLTPPSSQAAQLPPYTTSAVFDVAYTQADSGSGVAFVELWYSKDSGTWTSYGTFFSSPISFDSAATGGDGFYEFEAVATDLANNREPQAFSPEASTTLDSISPFMASAITGDSAGGSSSARTKILIFFNEDLDGATVNPAGTDFAVQGHSVTAADEISAGLVELTIDVLLETDETPEVTIVGPIKDPAGNQVTPGAVQPADGLSSTMDSATTVTTTAINVFFSEPLDSGTVQKEDFVLSNINLPEINSVTVFGSMVVITTVNQFGVDSTPIITLVGPVEDLSGNGQNSGAVTAGDGIGPTAGNVTILLEKGWNFISFGKELDDDRFESVFQGVDLAPEGVMHFDPINLFTSVGQGDRLEPLTGYWAKVNTPATLNLNYSATNPGSALLTRELQMDGLTGGFFTVGTTHEDTCDAEKAYTTIDESYNLIFGWDNINQKYTQTAFNGLDPGNPLSTDNFVVEEGKGYYIFLDETDTLAHIGTC